MFYRLTGNEWHNGKWVTKWLSIYGVSRQKRLIQLVNVSKKKLHHLCFVLFCFVLSSLNHINNITRGEKNIGHIEALLYREFAMMWLQRMLHRRSNPWSICRRWNSRSISGVYRPRIRSHDQGQRRIPCRAHIRVVGLVVLGQPMFAELLWIGNRRTRKTRGRSHERRHETRMQTTKLRRAL